MTKKMDWRKRYHPEPEIPQYDHININISSTATPAEEFNEYVQEFLSTDPNRIYTNVEVEDES